MYIRFFDTLTLADVPSVGGKNASLGELILHLKHEGIAVPDGFATTTSAYWSFLEKNGLKETLSSLLSKLKAEPHRLAEIGKKIRETILEHPLPQELQEELKEAYLKLCLQCKSKEAAVAVRSSATAEDLPTASFAGQQESFLNVRGMDALLTAFHKCLASLFTDRAISYREAHGFNHMSVALSVGIQKMVRADRGASGVMFTLHTESGFPNVVVINAAFGLGENVVQGTISPDEYLVFKPLLDSPSFTPIIERFLGNKTYKMVYAKAGVKNVKSGKKERSTFVLSDADILTLARWATRIEKHYGKPMDIEWAKDGMNGELFIVQARPETVQSQKKASALCHYTLKERGKELTRGLSIGEAIACGKARVIHTLGSSKDFEKGDILVTEMTSPDWVPLMRKAAGIITDHGGRTSHAAIVSRELGVPAIVGTENATKKLSTRQEITLSCAEGDTGIVYEGRLPFEATEIDLTSVPKTKTAILLNISGPTEAFHWWKLPCKGIGLARMEFIINNTIKIHPMALLHPEKVQSKKERALIDKLTQGYESKAAYFVSLLSQGIGMIAASRYPDPVIVRMSDFKTNEYANLIGGKWFEPKEENPMLGFRGASRYYSAAYKEGFELECKALLKARDEMGLTNIVPMIPFCRTLEEADKVLEVMAAAGLKRGERGLQIYVMCEIPSNVLLAKEFAERFDGFSIGSNDLTQLTLGIDRDSAALAPLFDERNPAIKKLIQELITVAHQSGRKVGICGQAPSDYPDFAAFLVSLHIDSISLNPDSVLPTIHHIASLES